MHYPTPHPSSPALWSGWTLSLYPDAGEAGGCFYRPPSGGKPGEPDPERAAAEAARRARTKVRRYCAANGLNRLGTLTYAGDGCRDPVAFRADIAAFFRGLRPLVGAKAFPYAWVPEWHKGGHGLHAHFAVGQFVGKRKIEQAWGRGHVHIKLLGDLPVGSTARDEARRAAGYLSKYIGKDFGVESRGRLHRYDVAQGFQPRVEKIRGRSSREVLQAAAALMLRWPDEVWTTEGIEGYDGPPRVSATWR